MFRTSRRGGPPDPRDGRPRATSDVVAGYPGRYRRRQVRSRPRDPWSTLLRPSVSSMANPGVSVVLVMLCWIFHVARKGTSIADGISCDITNCFEDCIFMMYLFALWCCIPSSVCNIERGQSQNLYVYICDIVPGQLTIFVLELMIAFLYVSH